MGALLVVSYVSDLRRRSVFLLWLDSMELGMVGVCKEYFTFIRGVDGLFWMLCGMDGGGTF